MFLLGKELFYDSIERSDRQKKESMNKKKPLEIYVQALRLPFLSASVFPFMYGSCVDTTHFQFYAFFLGLIAVVSTHLAANLMNDYADSKSGADWVDRKFYGFFGGSKLIQHAVFSERFYLKGAVFLCGIALAGVLTLSFVLHNFLTLFFYLIIVFLGFSYSHKPFQFSYHRWGEVCIFFLFGPALVMGGYFIQHQLFPTLKSFFVSLPFGFLTTAVLFASEVPDYETDRRTGKNTWVGFTGPRYAFILYGLLILSGYISIGVNIIKGYSGAFSLVSIVFILFGLNAVGILKNNYREKDILVQSSRLTIIIQFLVSLVLIGDIFL